MNEEQRTKHEARRKDPAPVSINGDGEGDGASSLSSAITTLDERSATAKQTYKNALMLMLLLRYAILDQKIFQIRREFTDGVFVWEERVKIRYIYRRR